MYYIVIYTYILLLVLEGLRAVSPSAAVGPALKIYQLPRAGLQSKMITDEASQFPVGDSMVKVQPNMDVYHRSNITTRSVWWHLSPLAARVDDRQAPAPVIVALPAGHLHP